MSIDAGMSGDVDIFGLARFPVEIPKYWWLAVPSVMGTTRWYDIVEGRLATLNGIAVPSTSTSGWGFNSNRLKPGVLNFDGSGDSLDITIPSVGTGDNVSLSLWIYPNNWTGAYTCIFDSADRKFNSGFWNSSGTLDQSYQGQNLWGNLDASSPTVPNDAWAHLVYVRSGTSVTLYVNGVAYSMGTNSNAWTGATVGFASNLSGGGSNFTGQMDDIQWYLRGLSAVEVQLLYEAGLTGYSNLFQEDVYEHVFAPSAAPGGFSAYWARPRGGIIGAGGLR